MPAPTKIIVKGLWAIVDIIASVKMGNKSTQSESRDVQIM